MGDVLGVFHADRRIGQLRFDAAEQLYAFQYEKSWADDPHAFSLAPLLPKQEALLSGSAVKFFFSNLLPEGQMLELVAKSHAVSQYDPFGLLRKIGAECAGALKILETEVASGDGRTYTPVSNGELSARARVDAPDVLSNLGGKVRMSLAGVQDKLPVVVDGENRVFVPEMGSASTHILKPNHRDWKRFPHTTVNEHFCMTLARRLGLDVPRSFLISVPERIYVVERFDRVFVTPLVVVPKAGAFELQGEPVHRRHQIDVCQLLGLPPTQKYEEPEYQTVPGPGVAAVVEAVSAATGEALRSRRSLIDWVIFNYLIGNSDSHSKNVSLLWVDERWRLAPSYDLLSVAVYSDDPEKLHDFALKIGGETHYGWITGASWHEFAAALGVSYRYVGNALKGMAERITKESAALKAEISSTLAAEEKIVLAKIVALIALHASYADESSKTISQAAHSARASTPRARSPR
ncbi:MAG: type II toxin-antitoxin system HipA family toxin [Betaproteobacteria bacterium]